LFTWARAAAIFISLRNVRQAKRAAGAPSLAKPRIDFASSIEKLYNGSRFKLKPAANV
jgi:hypothetical protein